MAELTMRIGLIRAAAGRGKQSWGVEYLMKRGVSEPLAQTVASNGLGA